MKTSYTAPPLFSPYFLQLVLPCKLFLLPCCFGHGLESVVTPHKVCVILLNDIMNLNRSTLGTGTLVPAAYCCVFYVMGHQIYRRLARMTWFLLVLKHRQTHTGYTRTNRLTHKYILIPPVLCTQQLPILHWMKKWCKKFTLRESIVPPLFKKYSLVEDIYLPIRFRKTKSFLWNTKNTERNGVYEQNAHTTHWKER